MTFAFISHTQGDKLRPDGRMRELVRYLHEAGIPLWIDRPEEVSLSARDLEERCIEQNGVWTSNIRDALNRCSAGIGVWSLHTAHRLGEDANGVLYQELSTLSISERLHLVSIDPGAAVKVDGALKHLAGGRQVIDLAVEPKVFAQRLMRLIEALAVSTKVKRDRIKPYVAALEDRAAGRKPGGLLHSERKRAHEIAAGLFAAFALHNPGRLPLRLAPEVATAYERMLAQCRERNARFRTYHRLLALMQTPSQFLQQSFDSVEPGLAARIDAWLKSEAEQSRETWVEEDIGADALSTAARAMAEAEMAEMIDERHAVLAILEGGSGTADALRSSLGAERFEALISIARKSRPALPAFAKTVPIGRLGERRD